MFDMAFKEVPAEITFNLEDLQRQHKQPWRRAAKAALILSVVYSTILYVGSRFGYRIPEDMMIAGVVTGALMSATYGYYVERFCNRHGQPPNFKRENDNKDINWRKHIVDCILNKTDDATSLLRDEPEESILKTNTWIEEGIDEIPYQYLYLEPADQSPEDLVSALNTENDFENFLEELDENVRRFTRQLLDENKAPLNLSSNLIGQSPKILVTMINTDNNPILSYPQQEHEENNNALEINGVSEISPIFPVGKFPNNLVSLSNTDNKFEVSDHRQEFDENALEDLIGQLLEINKDNKNSSVDPSSLPGKDLVVMSDSGNNPEVYNLWKDSGKKKHEHKNLLEVNEVYQYSNIILFEKSQKNWDAFADTDSKIKSSEHTQTPDNTGKAPIERILELREAPEIINIVKLYVQDQLV